MRIFMTGATGVLGRPVLQQLVRSEYLVRGLAHSKANAELLRRWGAEPVAVDLFDTAALAEAVQGCQAVLHLATGIPGAMNLGRRSAGRETNHLRREATRCVVDAALEELVQAVVYPSICFGYPDSGAEWIDSTTTTPIAEDYNKATFEAEAEVDRFAGTGRRGIVLRMGFMYGPESPQSHDQLRLARLGIASVSGRPGAYHPFVAITDAARALVAALQQASTGTYDIVEDEPPTTEEINRAMAQAVGRRHLRALPTLLTDRMVITGAMRRSQRVSNRRFRIATGWSPRLRSANGGWELVAGSARQPDGRANQ